jgi:response regulator RpfG family c-di-GMP phosphodiesterase
MKRIIFVDDEEKVLLGIKRMLRSLRMDWDITLADNGLTALEHMRQGEPFDLIVSDMRMPEMDGVELLKIVKEEFPQTVRFGFSGQTDSQTMLKMTNITHQFMNKPCEPRILSNRVARALALRESLDNPKLRQLLLTVGTLPSVPAMYQEVMNEIHAEDPSIARIGKTVSEDVAMSAKILQIVNSAYTGLRHHVSDPVHAVSLLGLDNLKSIVLTIGVFSMAENKTVAKGFSLSSLWDHSLRVSRFARQIAENEGDYKRIIDDSFTAGLLHDVGQIVLATQVPEEFEKALKLSTE